MPETTKPSWTCRWIERVRAAHPEWEQGAGRTRPGLRQKWVERHEARCPHCGAERARWSRALAALRSTGADAAPAHILQGVMARIAAERADSAPGHKIARRGRVTEAESSSWADRTGGWDLGQAAPWAAGAVALGWAASVRVSAGTIWWSARAELLKLIEEWTGAARSGWDSLSAAFEAVPPGLEPYLTAGLWCAVGLSAAVVSTSLAARLSER